MFTFIGISLLLNLDSFLSFVPPQRFIVVALTTACLIF